MTDNAHAGFQPAACLAEYYNVSDGENDRLMAFHARAQASIPAGGRMLEFGGGPTIYQMVSAAARKREIHFVDYREENLTEVRRWLTCEPGRHDWAPLVARALEHERAPDTVEGRQALIRSAITRLGLCDAFADPPIPGAQMYDLVAINFVLECITAEYREWKLALARVLELVKPRGYLVLTAVTGASEWRVRDAVFPATMLRPEDIRAEIGCLGFETIMGDHVAADASNPSDPSFAGYTGIYMALARRGTRA